MNQKIIPQYQTFSVIQKKFLHVNIEIKINKIRPNYDFE